MSDLLARDLDVLWHPCSQMADYRLFPPLPIRRAEGVWLELEDGRRLLDAISSWWCKSLGHGYPRIVAAIRAQLERFEHVILANTTHEGVVRLCERLCAICDGLPTSSWAPQAASGHPGLRYRKVFLADNGSTAVEVAVKMAVHAQALAGQPERRRIAGLRGGYHGETMGAMAASDLGLYADPYRALFVDMPMLGPLPLRTGPQDPAWLDASAEWPAIEAHLDTLAQTLAAVVYEPVLQGAGGMRLVSPDFYTRLRRWADGHGVMLIADEIAAGMGRCGPMLASQLCPNAEADIVVVSKGLTGGALPLSAVITTDAIYERFLGVWGDGRAFLHSNTWAGNALAVAVANAALDAYAEDGILAGVAQLGPRLQAGLAALATTRPWLGGVRGVGMMAAVELRRPDGGPLDPAARTGFAVYRAAVERGALLRNLGDTIYLVPPLTISADEVELLLGIVAEAIDAVCAPA